MRKKTDAVVGKGEKKPVHERQWAKHGHVWWRRRVAEAERRVRGRKGREWRRIQMQINGRIVNEADGNRMGSGMGCGRWNGRNGKVDVIDYVQDSPEYPRRRADCTSASVFCGLPSCVSTAQLLALPSRHGTVLSACRHCCLTDLRYPTAFSPFTAY